MKAGSFITIGAALAMGIASFGAASTPAMARDHGRYQGHYDRGYGYGDRHYRGYGYDRGYRHDRDYAYRGGYYDGGPRYYRGGYYRCGRDSGTGGAIIGAIAGGLLGNEVARRDGNGTTGAIIGAGVGALAGHAIDRGDRRC